MRIAEGTRSREPSARGSIRRTLAIAGKEVVQLRRDYLIGSAMLLFPMGLLLFFGFAFNLTLDEVPVAVVDPSGDRVTEAMLETFERVAGFVTVPVERVEDGLEAVRAGAVRAVLVLPAGALETVRAEGTLTLGFYLDDADPSMAAQVSARAAAAVARFTERLLATRGVGVALGALPLQLQTTRLYNPEARSAVFMVPALIGLIQVVSAVVPLRYFNEIARAVMLRGAGVEQSGGAVLALALFAVVMLVAASLRMRTTL